MVLNFRANTPESLWSIFDAGPLNICLKTLVDSGADLNGMVSFLSPVRGPVEEVNGRRHRHRFRTSTMTQQIWSDKPSASTTMAKNLQLRARIDPQVILTLKF